MTVRRPYRSMVRTIDTTQPPMTSQPADPSDEKSQGPACGDIRNKAERDECWRPDRSEVALVGIGPRVARHDRQMPARLKQSLGKAASQKKNQAGSRGGAEPRTDGAALPGPESPPATPPPAPPAPPPTLGLPAYPPQTGFSDPVPSRFPAVPASLPGPTVGWTSVHRPGPSARHCPRMP